MAVFRIERTRDYTVMSNHHLRNANLSLKAKGLLSMMLSLPEDWNYTTRGLAKICKEGVDAIGAALRELEGAGYIVRHQRRDKSGRITDTEYVIYEQPQPDMSHPDTASPDTENPDMVKPDTEKPAELNIEKSNTEKTITYGSSTDSIPFRETAAARPPERKGRDAMSVTEILFLVSAGLLSSLSPDNFVNQWGESDFALTYSISEEGNLLSDEMLQQIETMQGIENLRVTYSASPWPTMDVIYDENVFGKYIDSLDGVSGLDFSNAETRKNYTDNFWSGVYGIDSRYIEELNKTLDKPIDLTAFEKGELVVLSAMTDDEGNLLIQPGQAITVVGESGEQVFTVATGFLDADFQSGRGNERGTAPDLYISKQAIEKLSGETKIFRIAFDTIDSSYDKGIMEQLQSITASSPGITILSRYEKQQEMAGYLLTSRIIAAGLSAVFLLIGIMNFINTMVVSVNTRKHEFATLESIGMTKKQIRNVLLWEGVYYWSISFLLLATLGTAIYIPIYSAFRRMVPYAAFHYPVISLLVVAAIVLLVCLATPVITFMQNVKQSVVERLRQN